MAKLLHADLVVPVAVTAPCRGGVLVGLSAVAETAMEKSACRCHLPGHRTRSPKDGLPRAAYRPPDDGALSLQDLRGQAQAVTDFRIVSGETSNLAKSSQLSANLRDSFRQKLSFALARSSHMVRFR